MNPVSEHLAPKATDSAVEWTEHTGFYERASSQAATSSDTPAVIYFHGRGQHPLTAARVADAFTEARLLAPTGEVLLKRGTTWFENRRIGVAEPQSLLEAERRFLVWLSDYLDEKVQPWLCGFSNGGAFASYLLMYHPKRFAGAALLSAPFVLPPHPAGALTAKPVFYAYGTRDNIVPEASFEQAKTYLTTLSGGKITLREYDSAHEITEPELAYLAAWFRHQRASAILSSL